VRGPIKLSMGVGKGKNRGWFIPDLVRREKAGELVKHSKFIGGKDRSGRSLSTRTKRWVHRGGLEMRCTTLARQFKWADGAGQMVKAAKLRPGDRGKVGPGASRCFGTKG